MGCCSTGLTWWGYGWAVTSAVAGLICSAAFYAPHWLAGPVALPSASVGRQRPFKADVTSFGSFRRCNFFENTTRGTIELSHGCGRYRSFEEVPSVWWRVSTVCGGCGAALALLVAFVALPACCLSDVVSRSSALLLGLLQVLAALLVGTSCILYPLGWSSPEVKSVCGSESGAYRIGACWIGWAFYVQFLGAALLLVCGIMSTKAGRPVAWLPANTDRPAYNRYSGAQLNAVSL